MPRFVQSWSLSPFRRHDKHDILPHDTPALYAIADIHGDYPRALSALQHAKVVDEAGSWVAGNATLVQTGDIVDRGPDTQLLYRYFRNLTRQASRSGGRVVKLWGNHEYMNAMYDWRYVDEGDLDSFPAPSTETRERAFSIEGEIGSDWMVDYAVTYRDARYRAHFMHAGLSPEHAADETDEIGKSFMRNLLGGARAHSQWTETQRRFWDGEGPMWYRGYALLDEAGACRVAGEVMHTLDVDFLVMGHTPNFDGALTRCGGRVLLIDTGLSGAYGGRPVVLQFSVDEAAQRQVKLWYDDDRTVETVYPE
ncbi:Uncharacterized protein C1840.07c [Taphrina deformans PYCC 5710]|uniref:Uncharacterized protein C1840.07c n=1 Tax=Taphrina deformans (strain PYCC 5710 / ATCC 11124 / CBS 356.35 / IMI 108563 / JCM 9778 / NBRC 8474) TaxID=1097556 RepID=R4XBI1_TAPDE|nr:Uncharacterized protein C1840.07c [Taphrina deformans PYCC 5710]|eukprot:CCG83219.1 Uncharacterized protein C1840.07c [Taphrina deformans PYCC 5710]